MARFDLSPLYRSSVGFDRFVSLVDSLTAHDAEANGYPPYNIERVADNEYRISMAVAGFAQDDIDIEVKENALSIKGAKSEDNSDSQYLHRGLANRAFERRFQLADHVQVKGADLKDGMLAIDLVRELPEAMKPRTIEIGAGTTKVIEDKSAA
ncbi:MAG: Hsp20 family protein [Hyphomicrobiaceae bacterium]